MCDTTHAPTECCHGGRTRRPYVGRYVRPPPRDAPPERTVPEMIASMIDCVRMARKRAYRARGEGNHTQASEAFYDAYTYVEMIRDLKERL